MKKQSKRMKKVYSNFDKTQVYPLEEAIKILKENSKVNFDPSVELHMNLGILAHKTDQIVKGSMVLPHGTGKKLKIVVFADGEYAQEAEKAGADVVGNEELIEEIKKSGKAPYDAAIAVPKLMKKLGPIARTLGVRGLMPNPKKGTVTTNVTSAIEEIRKGKIDFRNDDSGNLHQVVGKLSLQMNN